MLSPYIPTRFYSCLRHWILILCRVSQIWYLAMIFVVFALVFTIFSTIHPKDLQPETYGHIQTPVDLMNEWPRRFGEVTRRMRSQVVMQVGRYIASVGHLTDMI